MILPDFGGILDPTASVEVSEIKQSPAGHLSLLLEELEGVMSSVPDSLFRESSSSLFASSIGSHVRHILDHIHSFLTGRNSVIDYDDRERDRSIEKDRSEAIVEIRRTAAELSQLRPGRMPVTVRALIHDESDFSDFSSSAERELLFLISHTVHHNAIIAAILKESAISVPKNFGLAPSTIAYNKTRS